MDPEPRGGAKAEAAAVKATKMTVRYIMVRRMTWKAVFIASGQVASKGSEDGSRDPSPVKKQPTIKFLGSKCGANWLLAKIDWGPSSTGRT